MLEVEAGTHPVIAYIIVYLIDLLVNAMTRLFD